MNATGDALRTDGSIAVVQLQDCDAAVPGIGFDRLAPLISPQRGLPARSLRRSPCEATCGGPTSSMARSMSCAWFPRLESTGRRWPVPLRLLRVKARRRRLWSPRRTKPLARRKLPAHFRSNLYLQLASPRDTRLLSRNPASHRLRCASKPYNAKVGLIYAMNFPCRLMRLAAKSPV